MSDHIRNFVIIAHVDHGKSTLADRLLEYTGTIDPRQMKPQYLDQMELERERGITIKMAPVRMRYGEYVLNLIDTPGHADFAYEVSRALAAVEGALLLVDATQGIQAQTLVNFRAAERAGLTVIGAVNKIDLFTGREAELRETIHDLALLLGVSDEKIFKVSGKAGIGIRELLDAVVTRVPSPQIAKEGPQALIFDSFYDEHKGVIASVRVYGGMFRQGDDTLLVAAHMPFAVKEIGYFIPRLDPNTRIEAGEIGYCATGIKDPDVVRIGDTIGARALPGYTVPNPVIFVSLYPDEAQEYDALRHALQKLKLNDSSLSFEPDMNEVLGRGFKCGFLGQLHFEITTERLLQEFNLETVSTLPSVRYTIRTPQGTATITSPDELPDDTIEICEPMVRIELLTPARFIGNVLQLKNMFRLCDIETFMQDNRVRITASMPLNSLIADFDGQLKSVSEGMASFSYERAGEATADMERVQILVAGDPVPGLTRFVYKDELVESSRKVLVRLKELLPKQQFSQALQARARGDIIARETIPALRKDVTGYLYGGDRTRKMKLWKKQQKGKKRLKESGRVTLSADIFKALLKK